MKENDRKTNPTIYLWMGLVWIGLALFGLAFDPDKSLIMVSQVIAGVGLFRPLSSLPMEPLMRIELGEQKSPPFRGGSRTAALQGVETWT